MSGLRISTLVVLGALTVPAVAFGATAARGKPIAIQIVDAGPLSAPAPASLAALQAAPATQASALMPAPVPNVDAEPPKADGGRGARLNPALLSRAAEFQGNGFANASNQDHGALEKEPPAAGLNLSVPVVQ